MKTVPLDVFQGELFALSAELFPTTDPAHDPSHQKRMAGLVARMQRKEGGDSHLGAAIAVLHDMPEMLQIDDGKSRTNEEWSVRAAKKLGKIDPERFGRSSDFVKLVEVGIAAQKAAPKDIPQLYPSIQLEALQVRAAEDMEGMGALGFARGFTMGGLGKRPFYHGGQDAFCDGRIPDDQSTIDFLTRLTRKVAGRIKDYTPAAQSLLWPRLEFMQGCLTDFRNHLESGETHQRFLKELSPEDRKLREDILKMVDRHYAEKDPAHDANHVRRVIVNMERIWCKEGRPAEVPLKGIWISGFAHDLVQYDKHSAKEPLSAPHSARLALRLLEREVPDLYNRVDRLTVYGALQAAAGHSWSHGHSSEVSLLSKFLQDGDRVDNVGAIGLARTFTMGAVLEHKRPLHSEDDPACLIRVPDCKVATADVIPSRLVQIPQRLHTESARATAEKGVEFINRFWTQFQSEVDESRPAISTSPAVERTAVAVVGSHALGSTELAPVRKLQIVR